MRETEAEEQGRQAMLETSTISSMSCQLGRGPWGLAEGDEATRAQLGSGAQF